ncbi:MAG TPA: PAS domain-containing protein, partial [Chthoniobacteraceae bacterium]|nr:PAS domain-containing protein [Chthoniobacteraceae bacterium]
MPKFNQPWWSDPPASARYAVAFGGVIMAVILAMVLDQFWHCEPYVSLFLCAIVLSAWFGGFKPGFVAVAFSTLAFDYFFVNHRLSFTPASNEVPRIVLFAISGLVVGTLSSLQRSSSKALRKTRDDLAEKVRELGESESRLNEAERVAHIGYWERDVLTGRIIWSDETYRIWGLQPQERAIDQAELQKLIHPDDRQMQLDALAATLNEHRPYDVEYRIVRPNGQIRFLKICDSITLDASGRLIRIFGTVQDITERKLDRLLLEGQKRVLEMIASAAPLGDSLTALVRLTEEMVPGMQGSILLLDPDGRHLRHGAAPSLPPEYVAAIDGQAIGPEAGSCGTAAYLNQPVVVEDIATDPLWKEYGALALPHGLRACWSTPIYNSQWGVMGTFAMYYRQPARPTAEHLRLIEMATHTASIAIFRNRTVNALRASESRLKEAERVAHIGNWERDPTSNLVSWSDELYRIFGMQRRERVFPLAEFQKLIHPGDRELQGRAISEALEGKKPYDVEFRIIRPDGEIRFVHSTANITRDESGRPTRFFGTVQDITERKLAEEFQRAQEKEIKAIVENSPDPIVRYNRELQRTYVNPAFARALGTPGDELVGREFGSTMKENDSSGTATDVENLHNSLKQVFDTGAPLDFETTWPMPAGPRSYTVHLEPEFDSQGVCVSV